MTYQQTIDYLFSQLPMFSRVGVAAYKKDLDNIEVLCEFLSHPEKKLKSIHVAGTNGKGSVSHMLSAVLQTAGYKTGLYTSPHLKDFRERIKIDGAEISQEFIVEFTEKIKPVIGKIEPSFFEITVAMAFDYFVQHQVDIAVIEVGLGGRLDSTNIITPEISVITNIGWDHMNILGDSLVKIAFEKAGIIKKNVPVIIGEGVPGTLPVFEKVAAEKDSPLFVASQQRQVTDWKWEKHELVVEVGEMHQTDHKIFHLDLPGIYQSKNLLTVLETCEQLHTAGWKTNEENIYKALSQVKKLTGLHGRWEVLHQSPLVVVDVAHNPDGIKQVMQQVELTEHKDLHIILGLVKDKDPAGVLELLPPHAKYYFTKAQIQRALPEEELQKLALQYGLQGKIVPEVNAALYQASLHAHNDDMILVCGSIFLVGELNWDSAQVYFNSNNMEVRDRD